LLLTSFALKFIIRNLSWYYYTILLLNLHLQICAKHCFPKMLVEFSGEILLIKCWWWMCLAVIQSVSPIWACYISQWWFGFRLEPIFNTAQAASKNTAKFESPKSTPKYDQALLIYEIQTDHLHSYLVYYQSTARLTLNWW